MECHPRSLFEVTRRATVGRALAAWGLVLVIPATALPGEEPPSPAEALRAFHTADDVQVQLVAAEPLVVDPVAFAFDERGRLLVAENRGYPTGPPAGSPPLGRLALLEDANADGLCETRHEFATGLSFPNGVMPWNGGWIVTSSPDILYLKDTNGDHRADERRVLFTGLATSGSSQLRASHPTLGLDGWVYVTGGLTGGKVTCPSRPEQPPVEFGRADFRFLPDLSRFEACPGGGQFGQTFDAFGRRFICYNRVHVQHVVFAAGEAGRNKHFAFAESVHNCPQEMQAEPLRGHGRAARIFPLSSNKTTADSHAGTFTAACGVFALGGPGLPEKYRGGVFACDPTGNLVHFDELRPEGATFAAVPLPGTTEFLATADDWFRPVFLASGPDGALYVADMVRRTIEHPDYLPPDIRRRTDFVSGNQAGRIWRVGTRGERRPPPGAWHDFTAETALWAERLRDENDWIRDTAFRICYEHPTEVPRENLLALLHNRAAPPTAQVRALRLLYAAGQLPDEHLVRSLAAPHARLREHALQLAALRPERGSAVPALVASQVAALAADADARVRFQAALTLGALELPERGPLLARIARQGTGDRWTRAAVLSSAAGHEQALLGALALPAAGEAALPDDEGACALLRELGRLVGLLPPAAADEDRFALTMLSPKAQFSPAQRCASLAAWAQVVGGPANRSAANEALRRTARQAEGEPALEVLVKTARELAQARLSPAWQRIAALELLAVAGPEASATEPPSPAEALFLGLLVPEEPREVQQAAVRALVRKGSEGTAGQLLAAARFAAYVPALREEVLQTLLSDVRHVPAVLAALEAGHVPPGAIDGVRRQQLLNHAQPDIRQAATRLFAATSATRMKVYEEYKTVIALPPQPANGRAVFRRVCANCHRLDQEGVAVGPDLFGIRTQPKEAILLHLLIPEQEIAPGFVAYVAETHEGRSLAGILVEETASAVRLRAAGGQEHSLLRSELARLAASPVSLMPQDLEKNLSRQELADLLAYLKGE